MRVTDRRRERIGRVGCRKTGQRQQSPHHFLHLRLARPARADDRLLHLSRRVFAHREAREHGGRDGRAACLAEEECRIGIDVHEHLFHRDLGGALARDDVRQVAHDHAESNRKAAAGRADAAAADVDEAVAADVENAEARDAKSGIDAEDATDADGKYL